jgi:hypothetical protein
MKFMSSAAFVSLLLTALVTALVTPLAACGGDGGSPDATPVQADAAIADAAVPDATPTFDATPPADAHPPDLSCVNMEPPVGVVPDPLTIAGHTRSIGASGSSPVVGAAVEVRKGSDDSVLATDTSIANGVYSVSVATGGAAVTGYIHVSADTYFPSNLFPPDAIQSNIASLTVPLFSTQLLPLLATFAGTELIAGDGVAILQIDDCAGDSMAGVQIQVTNGNADTKVVYGAGDNSLPSPSATETDEGGTVFILNMPPGPITISGTYGNGAHMHSVDAKAFADQATLTQIHP